MPDPTQLSLARAKLYEESMKSNVMYAHVIGCKEELAEAESAMRAQRERVSRMIEQINMLESGSNAVL